jgi:hypothetical protein
MVIVRRQPPQKGILDTRSAGGRDAEAKCGICLGRGWVGGLLGAKKGLFLTGVLPQSLGLNALSDLGRTPG